jgi:P-type Ca2+ transporter type 2C
MAVRADATGQPTTAGGKWYTRSPEEVAADLGVDPAAGLTAARAAELLNANGPNALPEETPKPGWRRFLEEYRVGANRGEHGRRQGGGDAVRRPARAG